MDGQAQPLPGPAGPVAQVGAVVSIDAIYRLLLDTHDQVTALVGKVHESRDDQKALERRVHSLEKWRLLHLATGGSVGGGAAAAVSWALHVTGHG